MLIHRGASYLEKLSPIYPITPAPTPILEMGFRDLSPFLPPTPITTTKLGKLWICTTRCWLSRGPYIKIILDGVNGICGVQAKMKYEDWAIEDDWVTPAAVIEYSP